MDNFTNKRSYIYYKKYKYHMHKCKEIIKAKNPNKVLCKQCQFLSGFDPGVQAGFDSFKDGAYYCYCAYVLRISRYSGLLWVVPTNTGIILRGLKLYGESRT